MNNFLRNDIVEINSQEDELQFQIIDAYGEDIDKGMLNDRFQNLSYQINLFGITKEGKSVYCKVVNFKPYFFVKCPQNWSEYDVYQFKEYLCDRMGYNSEWKFQLQDIKMVKAKEFRGFTANKHNNYMKIIFNSYQCYKECRKLLYKKYQSNGRFIKLFQYESNIDPLLRFFHIKEIKPCSWIKLNKNEYISLNKSKSRTQISVKTKWDNCNYLHVNNMQCQEKI